MMDLVEDLLDTASHNLASVFGAGLGLGALFGWLKISDDGRKDSARYNYPGAGVQTEFL